MLFAGAIDLGLTDTEVALILGAFLLIAVAFAAVGGAIAACIAGERRAFWFGVAACIATTFLMVGVIGPLAAGAGWASSALVGVLRRRRRLRTP